MQVSCMAGSWDGVRRRGLWLGYRLLRTARISGDRASIARLAHRLDIRRGHVALSRGSCAHTATGRLVPALWSFGGHLHRRVCHGGRGARVVPRSFALGALCRSPLYGWWLVSTRGFCSERHRRAVVRCEEATRAWHRIQWRKRGGRDLLASLGGFNRICRICHGRSHCRRRDVGDPRGALLRNPSAGS